MPYSMRSQFSTLHLFIHPGNNIIAILTCLPVQQLDFGWTYTAEQDF